MAVPTLTTLDVTVGPTQGRTLVHITGTGFKTYPPPNTNGVTPVPAPTVEVLFGTEPAYEVQTESATSIWCLAPVNDPGLCAVTVRNLDAVGVPIPGETVTKANAYTFVRPYVRQPANPTMAVYMSDLYRLVSAVRREFKRQVLENTVIKKPHSEYSREPATGRAALAALPAVVLWGPRMTVNRFLTENSYSNHTTGGTTFKARRPVEARDVSFDVTLVSDNAPELVNMMAVAERFFDKNVSISMLRDAADPSKGRVEYELVLASPLSMDDEVDDQDNCTASASFYIRGFELQDTIGFTDDGVELRSSTVETVNYGQVKKEDT